MPLPSHSRPTVPATLRARGFIEAVFESRPDGVTQAASLEEGGGYRLRFPRRHARQGACEGAIINTGGGMAGGDRLDIRIAARERANLVISTPAAERIYGSAGPETRVAIAARLEAGARLAWLPQETILFGGARLARSLDVEMDSSSTLILAETTIFGRTAMTEKLGAGLFTDRWRIRRDGTLVHAEKTRLDGPIAELLARQAIGDGARAVATALMISPEAEDRLDAARSALRDAHCECGASAWKGLLLARFAARDPLLLRGDLVRFLLMAMQGKLPRLWSLVGDAAAAANLGTVEAVPASQQDRLDQDWDDRSWRDLRREDKLESDSARKGQAVDRDGRDRGTPTPRARCQTQPP